MIERHYAQYKYTNIHLFDNKAYIKYFMAYKIYARMQCKVNLK